ncbi:MAG: hypothetical protein HQ589_09815 [Syntrophaceae bacterium]|nr:hypothetical protein [Syntrophaceae bacterium]
MTFKRIKTGILWLSFFVIFSPAAQAFADAAPDPLHKGITPARKSSRVQMISEQVDIYLGTKRCDFEVSFQMKNPTITAESLEVGFPTSYENEVKNPIVRINDRRVKTRPGIEKEIERIEVDGKEYTKIHSTHWILWDMTFEPEETQTLTMSYWVKPAYNSDVVVTPYTRYMHAITDEFRSKRKEMPEEVSRLISAVKSYSTGYILVTGSGWDGIIENAVITVYHKEKGAGVVRWFDPRDNVTFSKNRMMWDLSFFEPDFDITIEFNGGHTVDEEIALVEKAIPATDCREALQEFQSYLYGLRDLIKSKAQD